MENNKEYKYYAQKMPSSGYWIWNHVEYRVEDFICSVKTKEQSDIICEAFNVANQTGMTPSTLQAELEKAKDAIKALLKENTHLELNLNSVELGESVLGIKPS